MPPETLSLVSQYAIRPKGVKSLRRLPTRPSALVMLAAVRDFEQATRRRVGVQVAGGIRTAKDAIQLPRGGE